MEDSGENEEDKYSGVQRGPNAYVPPAARRAMAATPAAAALAAVSQSAIARSAADTAGSRPQQIAPGEKKDKNQVYDEFNKFVQKEQSQAHAALQQQQLKKEKDLRLAELKNWGTSFKLKSPMPADIATIAARKASDADEAAIAANSAATRPTATPRLSGAEGNRSKAPQDTKYSLAKMTIPKIPPFNPEKARQAANTATAPDAPRNAPADVSTRSVSTATQPEQGHAQATGSSTKLRAGASSFKPFNPGAAVFKPGQNPTAAPAQIVSTHVLRHRFAVRHSFPPSRFPSRKMSRRRHAGKIRSPQIHSLGAKNQSGPPAGHRSMSSATSVRFVRNVEQSLPLLLRRGGHTRAGTSAQFSPLPLPSPRKFPPLSSGRPVTALPQSPRYHLQQDLPRPWPCRAHRSSSVRTA